LGFGHLCFKCIFPKIYAAPQGRNSLKILQHLQDCAYVKDEQVIIVCQVENATSYLWYKDGKLLEGTTVSFEVRGWKLFIRKFSETDAGVYQCVGKDGKGNFGKTAAKLLLEGMVYTYRILDGCEEIWILCSSVKNNISRVSAANE
jgi:hypothetical protein